MTRGQEKLGRALARAIRALEFDAQLAEGQPVEPDVIETGLGCVPRVEVRHPLGEGRGALWLVAVIALEPAPSIAYAVPSYRKTIELALARVMEARAA